MYRLMMATAALAAALVTAAPAGARATQAVVGCRVTDVSAFADRVHVRCHYDALNTALMDQSGQVGVYYFSVATSSPFAASFATLGTAARQADRPLAITFLTSSGANPPGCLASDCRAAVAARLVY